MPTFLRLGGTLSTTLPSMETCPESWVSSPATILSSVVLPEPLGPTILNNSPLSMLMFTSESTLLLPKLLLRPWIATLIRVSAHPFTAATHSLAAVFNASIADWGLPLPWRKVYTWSLKSGMSCGYVWGMLGGLAHATFAVA